MGECKHTHLKRINVVVLAGVLNRTMIICKDCGKVTDSTDYEVE